MRRPKDKANVEAGVGLITRRAIAALRDRRFFTLGELNAALSEKASEINSAQFARKPGSRASVFEAQEREELAPLPKSPFQVCSWERATVRPDCHVAARGRFYSVPFEYAGKVVYDQMPFDDRLGMLVDVESDKRLATKLANLVRGAKLRFPDARSESVVYDPRRGIEKEAMARYFSCKYVEDAADIVITGPTGSGKSWLSCALAMSACRHYRSARYCRMPELLNELAAAKAAGRYERVLAKYKKYELLVIDEFMLNVTTKDETRDLYELIEGRSQIHSTVFCSQYQEAGWLERLGGGTSAEGIVDRISNNAYRIRLTGDVNMRETTSKVKR